MYLSMLCIHFHVEIRSPIEQTLLGVVAKFLAEEQGQSGFVGRETIGSTRDLYDISSMIPDPIHGAARCLEFDCNATISPSNVLNCA